VAVTSVVVVSRVVVVVLATAVEVVVEAVDWLDPQPAANSEAHAATTSQRAAAPLEHADSGLDMSLHCTRSAAGWDHLPPGGERRR
jgi:hypothetical protein